MKRFFALTLAGLLLGLAACGGDPPIEPDPTTTEPPAPVPVSVQYVRTNGDYESHGKLVVIETREQLDEYYTKNRVEGEDYAPGKFAFDAGWDESKSFAEAMIKYGEAFFEDNLLVLAVLVEPSGSNRHEVTGMTGNTIHVKRLLPEMGTADMASWHLMVEVSRKTWDGNEFTLDITDGNAIEPSTTSPAKPKPHVDVTPAKSQKFGSPAAGANDFAFRLSKALLQGNGKKNFVSSPYSVWLPLAALVNATAPAHMPSLLNALGAAGFSEKELNEAAAQMLSMLTHPAASDHNPLRIANAVFVDKQYTLSQDFKKVLADSYQGSAQTVDFKSPKAVKTVNDWASKHTDGLIKDIIQEFDTATVAAIANAIYFSDRWDWEFNPDDTKQDIFRGSGGDTQAQFMLREGDNQTYYEDGKLQAMPLRFKTGGGLYILLPKDGDASALLSDMTAAYFEEIQKDSIQATGKLLLPRFKIDSGAMRLVDTLAALGVPLVDPNLSPITSLVKEAPLFISDAVQKAVIEVDEKGTTAAAVTVMMMAEGAMPPQPTKPFEMICDKPFAFVLYGNGGQILFTGVVNQL